MKYLPCHINDSTLFRASELQFSLLKREKADVHLLEQTPEQCLLIFVC